MQQRAVVAAHLLVFVDVAWKPMSRRCTVLRKEARRSVERKRRHSFGYDLEAFHWIISSGVAEFVVQGIILAFQNQQVWPVNKFPYGGQSALHSLCAGT